MAVLSSPLILLCKAEQPTAVLSMPLTLFCKAFSPMAVFAVPLLIGLVLSPTDKLQAPLLLLKLLPEKLPLIFKLPQILVLPPMPTPPATVSAPLEQAVLCVVAGMLTVPFSATVAN